jgi:predicted nucleic acid-binding protein
MIYADTSFLFAIYHPGDRFHAEATRLAAHLLTPIALTLLSELELLNGLHRGLASKAIDQSQYDTILGRLDQDEVDGILLRTFPLESELYTRARSLSKKFTIQISARSLDILHVAGALELGISTFVSFDRKQRLLVRKAGLKLLPHAILTR